jgi:HD-GYP domain-containing protein (c-di-GMP phosphodiesterase class II)
MLVEGRRLRHPLLDRQHMLLLAAGAMITTRFKELLSDRGVQEVLLHEDDAAVAEAPTGFTSAASVPLTSELTARLDELVNSGSLFAAAAGPQFKDRLTARGSAPYNAEQRALLVKQHDATCSMLDGMVKSALHGGAIDGDQIANAVGSYLVQFCFDADCVLDVASQARNFAALAQQSLHTSLLGMALAIEMGLAEADVRTIGLCGLLHDWGMTKVPEQIRSATRVLNRQEFAEVQKHPLYTVELLERINEIPPQVPLICFQIHEQPNGRGYPRGRHHDDIHPAARILRVADAYCALTSPRPFRLPLTPYGAMECLVRNARDRSYDPDVVRALLHSISLFPIGSYVVLDDASMARVIRRNGNHFAAPIVQVVRRPDGSRLDPAHTPVIIDAASGVRKIVKAMPTPGRQETALRADLQILRRA